MSTMRVTHVITDLQPGGEVTILSWMLPLLRECGIEGSVVALAPDVDDPAVRETEPMHWLRDAGIRVRTGGVRGIADVPSAGQLIASELHRFKPDVVHTYLFHAGMLARPLARVFSRRTALVSSVVNVDNWKTR